MSQDPRRALTRRAVSWWSETGFNVDTPLAEPPPEIGDVAARPDEPLRAPRAAVRRLHRASTSLANRPCRCRPRGPTTAYPSVCSSSPRPSGKTSSFGSPRKWKRSDRGPNAARRSTPSTVTGRAVTVAGGQGFYGDTPAAADALLAEGVDFLCLEALAELTLAILQKDRQRDETRGYTRSPAYLSRCRTSPTAAPRSSPTPVASTRQPRRAAIETHRSGSRGSDRDRAGRHLLPRLDDLTRAANPSPTSTPARLRRAAGAAAVRVHASRRVRSPTHSQGADVVITGEWPTPLFLGPLAFAHGGGGTTGTGSRPAPSSGISSSAPGRASAGTTPATGGHSPSVGPAVSDRRRRSRRDGDHPQARGSGGRVSTDTCGTNCCTSARSGALPRTRRRRRLHLRVSKTSTATACAPQACGTPATARTSCCSRTMPVGPANHAPRSPGPTPTRRPRPPRDLRKRVEMTGLDVAEWCVEYWGVDARWTNGPPRRRRRLRTARVRVADRVAVRRPTHRRTRRTRARAAHPFGPTAGMTGAGRGAGSATELLAIWPTLVSKHLVDAAVQVVLEEVH